ncbi:MAG: aminotransferase-like domain-containing protein [Acidimicrobiales bacterium]
MPQFGMARQLELVDPPRSNLRSSAIRDLLELTERPDVISLAGGLPCAELFPTAAIADATQVELREPDALQYSATQGYGPLREWIGAQRALPASCIVVTHGSQQALDLVARVLVDPGRPVALGDPGYVGAIQAFTAAGARLVGIPTDADGLRVDALSDELGRGLRPALVYVVPNFDNPTGATLSPERRTALCRLADRYGFWIVADDPYGELRWSGDAGRPLAELSDRVITLGSFSKTLCPGLRVGFAAGPAEIIGQLVLLKQAADLHTATLTQRVVLRVVETPGFLAAHLGLLRARYREQANALIAALEQRTRNRLRLSRPDGGMFVWAQLTDAGADATVLLGRSLELGVGFVPGAAFDVSAHHTASLRLSFATVRPDTLREGARRLAAALDCL